MIEALQPPKNVPHSEESERAVLAGVLLDPALIPSVSARLTAEDFYAERHRVVYQAMLELQAAGTGVDLRTLQAQLESQKHLEGVGGLAYLAGLDIDLPDLGRFDSYVEIVKERSVRRRLIQACGSITRDCLDGGLNAQEALGRAEQAVLGLGEEAIQRGFVRLGRVVQDTMADLEERPTDGLIGVPTGFDDLDDKTRGLCAANLIIIAGRPGMGKTSLALNMAQYAALEKGLTVGIFSLEMSQQELALRILSSKADVSGTALRSGHLSQKQWNRVIRTAKEVGTAPLYIDDSANPTLLEVSSKARRLRAEGALDLLILDYLQLMQAGGKHENRNLEIAAITRGLKGLSKELNIPVVALSQLSRQPERRGSDRRPQLADLRESGAIEQDADLVMFVYRDEVYHQDTEDQGVAELIIAKHRNGETGTIKLVFLGDITSFKNMAHQPVPSGPPF